MQKSYLLSNIDNILFFFICLSIIGSLFLNNNATAPFLLITIFLYILTLFLKQGAEIKQNKSTFFLLLYFITAIISTINSTLPQQSMAGLSKTILYLLFYCAVMQYLRLNRNKIPDLGMVIGSCVSFEIIIAFIQNYTDVMSAATWQDTSRLNPELVLTRVYGTLKPLNPNLFGGFLISASPFLWLITALFYTDKKYKLFFIGLIFSILTIPTIFMTGCRGAYLALFVMLFVLSIAFYMICKFHYSRIYEIINKKKKIICGAIFAGITFIMLCVPKISHRILSIFAMRNDSSTSFRMNVYQSSFQMFQDNFLMGIGCGNKVFREIYGLYMLSGFDALSAYSIYLETAVENGILGLLFYILFLFFIIKNGIQKFLICNDLKERIILTFGLLTVVGIVVHGFFDTIYFRPQIQLIFWSAVAMIFSYSDELSNK
ncbi:O-antigen ligase family protein [bacterium]|nr:O-antigen ligase family protein [bacterium]